MNDKIVFKSIKFYNDYYKNAQNPDFEKNVKLKLVILILTCKSVQLFAFGILNFTNIERIVYYDAIFYSFFDNNINIIACFNSVMTACFLYLFYGLNNQINDLLLHQLLNKKQIKFFIDIKNRTEVCQKVRNSFAKTFYYFNYFKYSAGNNFFYNFL